jgi:hypothetical protein
VVVFASENGMPPLFGLAGPAGAGLASEAGLLFLGAFFTITVAVFALFFRSIIATAVSVFSAAVITFVFQPWWAFGSDPSEHWEVREFQSEFHFLAWMWILSLIGAFTACVDAYQRRRGRKYHGL